jgi:hypothetical protein
MLVAQLLLQILEHRFGEPLFVGAAVKNLKCIDLRPVLREVSAKGLHQPGSFGFAGGIGDADKPCESTGHRAKLHHDRFALNSGASSKPPNRTTPTNRN